MRITLLCCILVSLAAIVTVSGDGDSIRHRRRVFVVDDPNVNLQEHQRDRALVDRHEKEAFLAENESELTRLLQMSIPLIRETEPEPEPEHIISIGKGKGRERKGQRKRAKDGSKKAQE
jgi:hypothetical protein